MGNALYAQATGVLLLFAFLFFIFLAAKGWRWHHVTTLVLIFFSSLAFVFFAAAVLKTRQTWQTRHQQMAQELEQEQAKTRTLRTGPLDLTAEQADSIRRLENELQRVIQDRGRVWREVQFNGAQGQQISLKFPERAAAAGEEAPPLHRLQPKTIVYAFKEIENPDGWKVPGLYMGEWVVDTAQPDSVILSPAQPLDQIQQGQKGAQGTWALYEVMPIDAPYKFGHLADDEDRVRELLMPGGWHTRPAMAPQEKYEEVVQQYLRDLRGEEASPDDPPERVWVEVELTQPWKQDVDAPEGAAVAGVASRVFDINGLAEKPDLRQGAASEFEVGDKILLDAQKAEELISQGIAKRVGTKYKRPLRDYAYALDELFRTIRELDDHIRRTNAAVTTTNAAIDKAKKQIAYRTDEKTKLGEDLAFVNKERDAVKQYLSTLQNQYAAVRADLYQLYSQNLKLVDQLRRIEQAVINAIQQQLADASQ